MLLDRKCGPCSGFLFCHPLPARSDLRSQVLCRNVGLLSFNHNDMLLHGAKSKSGVPLQHTASISLSKTPLLALPQPQSMSISA
jgi:hypothetical protein